MEISKYEKYIKLSDLPIATKVYCPDERIPRKGVIQIVHGMAEKKERYNHIINFFTSTGYVCVISDLRGHGENVEYEKDLGYIGDEPANLLVEDIHAVTIFIKNNYEDLPITIMAHSMGTMIARVFAKKYDEDIDALVLLGIPSMNPLRYIGYGIVNLWCLIREDYKTDKFINNLIVGGYNKKFAAEGVLNSWICSDIEVVNRYNKEPKCGFMFPLNGHKALIQLMCDTYSKRNWAMKNKKLKVYFYAGIDDACILNEERFKKSVEVMKKVGYKNVSWKLYEGMRHEILNEPDYIKVCKDILENLPVA